MYLLWYNIIVDEVDLETKFKTKEEKEKDQHEKEGQKETKTNRIPPKPQPSSEDDPMLLDDDTVAMLLLGNNVNNSSNNVNNVNNVNNSSNNPAVDTNRIHMEFKSNPQYNKFFAQKADEYTNRVVVPNERDKNTFTDIDNILKQIHSIFRDEYQSEYIHEVLNKTSFNIQNTFLYLSDRDEFKYLLFNDMEDYIIKNMRSSDCFVQVINIKGEELVDERKRYLGVD